MSLLNITSDAFDDLREKSKLALYKRDPEAWFADVLDGYWYSKQKEIVWAFADPDKSQTMTMVKSCNGSGKTKVASDLATWLVATVDPMELTIVATSTVFSQVKTSFFREVNDNFNIAQENGIILPGRFIADPALKVPRPSGGTDKSVIYGRRPATGSNLISSFQGIHDGYVAVFMDEAGGLPEDMWIGANAVTTNEHARILAIANPDALHTPLHERFKDRERFREWVPITISAYETPNLTGEVVHPDPVKDAQIKSHLVQKSWVEMMERQAHPNVVLAKVHGEFPKDDASSFFTQYAMDRAYNTELDGVQSGGALGVDLAFGGEDNTVVYLNRGGRVRKHSQLLYDDNPRNVARQIHRTAVDLEVEEVRIDKGGAGKTIYGLLYSDDEFQDAPYVLIGIQGGESSPDRSRWAQYRAFMYDDFRRQMTEGLLDLDPDDRTVKDQMQRQTYEINNRGAIQITTKQVMRSRGLTSPDELDAAIMSAVDLTPWTGNPLNYLAPGSIVAVDPSDIEFDDPHWDAIEF